LDVGGRDKVLGMQTTKGGAGPKAWARALLSGGWIFGVLSLVNCVPVVMAQTPGIQSPGNLASLAGEPGDNATIQISRNSARDISAFDLYTSLFGAANSYNGTRDALRIWVDAPSYWGGRVPAIVVDAGGNLSMRTSALISGGVANYSGSLDNASIVPPVPDEYMLGIWADVPYPAIVVRAFGGPGPGSGQAQVVVDGAGRERLAVAGDGTLQWSPPSASTFAASRWDTTLQRVSSGILRTQGLQLTSVLLNAPCTFSSLPLASSLPNGAQAYCSDCLSGASFSPCAPGGRGAMAFIINGAWTCS
jgi:hypothetical protein